MIYTSGKYIDPFAEKTVIKLIEIAKSKPSDITLTEWMESHGAEFLSFVRKKNDEEMKLKHHQIDVYIRRFKHASHLDKSLPVNDDVDVAITNTGIERPNDSFSLGNLYFIPDDGSLIIIRDKVIHGEFII